MADRDLMLIEFQSFTGLDDLEECYAILDQHDWNLQEAVQNALARLDSPEHEVASLVNPIQAVDDVGFNPFGEGFGISGQRIPPSVFPDVDLDASLGMPSCSTDAPLRMINFTVEYRQNNIKLVIPDNERVGRIKDLLVEQTQVPVAKQELHGWPNKNDLFIRDTDMLRDLKLPKENTLYLLSPELPINYQITTSAASENNDSLANKTFELIINHTDGDKLYLLNFPGTKTIKEVKIDVAMLINVPVRHQVWKGWPTTTSADDKITLAESGIGLKHELEVKSSASEKPSCSGPSRPTSGDVCDEMEVDSDIEDMFEEIPDVDRDSNISRPMKSFTHSFCLETVPENCENQTVATEHFCREFTLRYGEPHPVFYIGSLDDAIKDSLQCRARERKMLAIYLHHDNSILANVFCSQILCTETIVSYLSSNFITWAWDLTFKSNASILVKHCTTHFGSIAANTVTQKVRSPDKLPILLVIARNRGANEVIELIEGNNTINDIMSRLMQSSEMYKMQLEADIAEEDEREARENVLAEQDRAYQESLALDRAKSESKRLEEEQQKLKIEEERWKQMEEEKRVQREEAEKKMLREKLARELPTEPPTNSTEPVTTIRIRCPGGIAIGRRFLKCDPLRVLLNYITTQGFHVENYKVLTTFPRRDLSQLDKSTTFEQLKFPNQETIMLEEL